MIDVIGTDAGAPASLPEALQDLVRQADLIAAPQRMQPALQQWLEGHGSTRCINSDDPISLCKSLAAASIDREDQPPSTLPRAGERGV